jgi:hypothetical protein
MRKRDGFVCDVREAVVGGCGSRIIVNLLRNKWG